MQQPSFMNSDRATTIIGLVMAGLTAAKSFGLIKEGDSASGALGAAFAVLLALQGYYTNKRIG